MQTFNNKCASNPKANEKANTEANKEANTETNTEANLWHFQLLEKNGKCCTYGSIARSHNCHRKLATRR